MACRVWCCSCGYFHALQGGQVGVLAVAGVRGCESAAGDDFQAEVAAPFGPFIACSTSTAPTRRVIASRFGKIPTTSVRRRISFGAGSNGVLDCRQSMGMGSYKSAVVVGLGHSRCELIDAKLDAVEVLPLGKDAAACHDPDEVYVFGEHGPDSSADLVGPIGDDPHFMGVSSCRHDRPSGSNDTGPSRRPFFDGLTDCQDDFVGSSDVADGGDALGEMLTCPGEDSECGEFPGFLLLDLQRFSAAVHTRAELKPQQGCADCSDGTSPAGGSSVWGNCFACSLAVPNFGFRGCSCGSLVGPDFVQDFSYLWLRQPTHSEIRSQAFLVAHGCSRRVV